jgi:peptidoglycan/xylan/chitin deacetylase (PgdA/CDA1 family)
MAERLFTVTLCTRMDCASLASEMSKHSSRDLPACVVLSLDFELRWGVHDVCGLDIDAYRGNLEAEREVIPELLQLFAAHGLRATWAAVGAIGCNSWDDYFSRAPQAPKYANSAFAVKPQYADLDPKGLLHFAPDLMRAILDTPGHALGTHTFSHLFLRERGVTRQDAAADLAAAKNLHRERFGSFPLSLVFPRNQPAFIDVVRASSIKVWRGNAVPWYYDCEDSEHSGPLPRALKLIDAFNPLTRRAAPLSEDMNRASLFLRLNLPTAVWTLHLHRIRKQLDSLRAGEVFHIWFHPHNLGMDTRRRLARVEQIASMIAERASAGELRSCSMEDLIPAIRLRSEAPQHGANAMSTI